MKIKLCDKCLIAMQQRIIYLLKCQIDNKRAIRTGMIEDLEHLVKYGIHINDDVK